MTTYYTLTGDLANTLGDDASGVYVTIETNLPPTVPLVDTFANVVRLTGATRIELAPGQTFSTSLIATNSPDINVIDGTLRYLLRVRYRDANGEQRNWSSGYFEMTADADLSDVAGTAYTAPELGPGGGGGLTEADIAILPGTGNTATGIGAHAEGINTTASADSAHASGSSSSATGAASHAEGASTTASGAASHAEGQSTTALGDYSHSEGVNTDANAPASHAEGSGSTADALASHAEGDATTASGIASHAEGSLTTASGEGAHAEGLSSTASGQSSHAEGGGTVASGYAAHAEGNGTTASGPSAHAEGESTTASGDSSHAEGYATTASDTTAHAEGNQTTASGPSAHAEGFATEASGTISHAEGDSTKASGLGAHAEGGVVHAFRVFEHAEGLHDVPGGTNGLQRSHLVAVEATTFVSSPGLFSASGTDPITLDIHAGTCSAKFVILTNDGAFRWDVYVSATNDATSFAARSAGTVTINAVAGNTAPVYGPAVPFTWTPSGNSLGQILLTPSATISGRRVAVEIFEMGPVL